MREAKRMKNRRTYSYKALEALLPGYLNQTLSAAEQEAVVQGLQEDPRLNEALQEWQGTQRTVQAQALHHPPAAVKEQLMARVRACNLPQRQVTPAWFVRAWGVTLGITTLLLLWVILQPGIQLQWSVQQGQAAAFRIYRAPAGSADFTLLHESANPPVAQTYRFVDTDLWRGRAYAYRIVALGPEGQRVFSNEVTTDAFTALPGQLAVILTSMIIGYSAVKLIEQWPVPPRRHQIC